MKINNMSFNEAVSELSEKYDVPVRRLAVKEKDTKREKKNKKKKDAQAIIRKNKEKAAEALEYMEKRGFSKEELKKFGIGFSSGRWNDLIKFLKSKNHSTEELIELGLARKSESGEIFDYCRNRIMFPIYNEKKKLVGLEGRIITDGENSPKYLNSPDSNIFKKGSELFGLYARGEHIRKKGLAILMEGYLDVLTAHKHTFTNSVASLGTSFTNEQALLLKKYTNNVIIAYDNDRAGKEAVIKAGNILKRHDFNIRCLNIDDEVKDPDEYLRKYGKKKFLEILKESKGIFEFLFEIFSESLNLNEITGKRKILEKFKLDNNLEEVPGKTSKKYQKRPKDNGDTLDGDLFN